MKTPKSTTSKQSDAKKALSKERGEIKSDFPLSEKDEVKQAEQKLQQSQKKHS